MALRCVVFSLALLVAGIPAMAAAPTGSVEGRVICSDGNVPARSASVELVPLVRLLASSDNAKPAGKSQESKTDFNGSYVFPSVPAGIYIVYASKAGYSSDFRLVGAALSRFTPDQRKKLLAEFPQVNVRVGSIAREDVVIHRGGAIMGRVTVDTGGIPGRVAVIATMVSSDLLGDVSEGGKALNFALAGSTDDRGVYRIAGLPAGRYRIEVRMSEAYYQMVEVSRGIHSLEPTRTGTGALTIYAPDALTESGAKLVRIGDGDELSDVDITIPMSRLHSVGGIVTQDGAPLEGAGVSIYRQGKSVGGSDAMSTSDGSYRFDLLPAGTYTIKATYPTETTFPYKANSRHFRRTISIQLGDSDVLDANIDLPDQVSGK